MCAAAAPLPPRTGFTLVLEALLEELRRRHEVRVIAGRLPGQTGEPAHDVQLIPVPAEPVRDVLAAVLRSRPRYAARLPTGFRAAVLAELDAFQPDAVIVLSARLAQLGADLRRRPGLAALVVPLDAVHLGIQTRRRASSGLKRWLLGIEEARVRRFEATEYRAFDRVVVVSDQDRQAIEALDPTLRVEVIPNGVDTERFAPDPTVTRDPAQIVFTGVMSSPGNVVAAEFAAREVLPLVRAAEPAAHLVLVGRSPSSRVRALAAVEGVTVTGDVPDVRPWLAGSAVFLCPMVSGTGIKNKLLEAMAVGVPCVATPLGLGGLQVQDGRELLVGDGAAQLADRVVAVLRDAALADRLGSAGRAYVREHHAWADVGRRYERLLADLRERRR